MNTYYNEKEKSFQATFCYGGKKHYIGMYREHNKEERIPIIEKRFKELIERLKEERDNEAIRGTAEVQG